MECLRLYDKLTTRYFKYKKQPAGESVQILPAGCFSAFIDGFACGEGVFIVMQATGTASLSCCL